MTIDKKWEWLEEAKKLGYTIAAEERQRQYDSAQIPQSSLDLSMED